LHSQKTKIMQGVEGELPPKTLSDEGDPPLSRYQMIQLYNFHLVQCNSPSQKRCAEHPNCIAKAKSNTNRYGIWQNPSILIPACLGQDPMTDIRDASLPVGLINLGATCYMNSFIQCLYMNTTFRATFLTFDPSQIEDSVDREFISKLQHLFVTMQCGPRKTINPFDLTTILNLDVSQQQDILEFVKLLLEYLNHFLQVLQIGFIFVFSCHY
jgi:ubiquitin carboxyl-terminal hydrolase 48